MSKVKLEGNTSENIALKSRNPIIEFDELKIYLGRPYEIILSESEDKKITIIQPTMGQIIDIGSKEFNEMIGIFTMNTTMYRAPLWDMGLDWNVISDFELFGMLCSNIKYEYSKLIIPKIDFSKFQMYQKQLGEETSLVLYSEEYDMQINENEYFHISQYIREMFQITVEEKLTTDSIMKQWFINKDKRHKAIDEEKEKTGTISKNSLRSIISACVNHPGFKYKLNELNEVGVCQFYDSVKRLQIYESSTALMKGMYSGFMDSSKISSDSYNFMKDI